MKSITTGKAADKKAEAEKQERVAENTDDNGMAKMDSRELAKDLNIEHVPGRSALDSVSDENAPPKEDTAEDRRARKAAQKDDGVGKDYADELTEESRGIDRAFAEKGASKNDAPDLSKAAQARSAEEAAQTAPVSNVGTVLMVRDEPQIEGGPTQARVHQEQIADFKAHGWRTV